MLNILPICFCQNMSVQIVWLRSSPCVKGVLLIPIFPVLPDFKTKIPHPGNSLVPGNSSIGHPRYIQTLVINATEYKLILLILFC